MAEYDLSSRIGQYLDIHLVIPLLEFLQNQKIYDNAEIQKGKLELLSRTNMVDFAMDTYKSLYPEEAVPTALVEKRKSVLEKLKQFQEDCTPFTSLFEKPEVISQIKASRDGAQLLAYLKENFDFQPEMLDTLYDYAKFQFDCGNYAFAAEYLYNYRVLCNDQEKDISALWGKFACDILLSRDWEAAFEDLNALRDFIDGQEGVSPLVQLQQRTWLIHWSLFVFFNHPKGRDGIIDLFLYQPNYSNAIQTVCPHVLRYLTTAVITNKRRRNVLKDLVKLIQQESYSYRDPITEFLECLYVNFDFDGAQKKLRECETVLSSDFFLVACRDEFIENARLFIFETYCRIHNTISISMLGEKLNMTADKAEEWIVNLIRNARLDAAIDSKEGHVVMATQVPSVYHQVIEKTKNLSFRSQALSESIQKRVKQRLGKRGEA